MKNEKLISIVLPVYNGAAHMTNSIESVINQTYRNWELIIVNDCSTDDTLKVAEFYQNKDTRIHVISNDKNLKLPLTLNVGFAKARGEYYTWTSDDNMYKPEALSRLSKELDSDESCAMVYSDYVNIDADGNEIDFENLQAPQFIVTGNVCGASFLYRADIAKKVGEYDSNLFLAEDYDYWMRIYRNGKIKHIKEYLYLYRRHSASLSETKKAFVNMQTYKAIEKNFLALYTDAKKHNLENKLFDQMMNRVTPEYQNQTRQMLYSVNRNYKWYQQTEKLKISLYKGFCGKVWRILKGIVKR